MAESHDARLVELVTDLGGDEVRFLFRDLVQKALQELIDAELTEVIGAGPHERTETRTNQRNGARSRVLSTPAGDVELRIPKVREGAFFPSLLEPRRRVDRALWAVIMTAYVNGVSTRKVDDLVRALGVESGISKSTVSRICEQLDEEVAAFRDRALDHVGFRYVFVDATYLNGRKDHRVVSGLSLSLPGWQLTATGKCWTSTLATPKTRCSGPSSYAAYANGASTVSYSSSPMPTAA